MQLPFQNKAMRQFKREEKLLNRQPKLKSIRLFSIIIEWRPKFFSKTLANKLTKESKTESTFDNYCFQWLRVLAKNFNWFLNKVNRPDKHISFESTINGIVRLRLAYCGFLAIQTMILRVPGDLEISNFAKILNLIKPDEVQLNVPSRPIPSEYSLITRENIKECKQDLALLKTISKDQLEIIRQKLSMFTDLSLIIP